MEPLIIPEEYMKILENSNSLTKLNKMNLEEIIRIKNSSNNEKCIKCDRVAIYKDKDKNILLCWNHSI